MACARFAHRLIRHCPLQLTKKNGILKFFLKAPEPGAATTAPKSPPRPNRDPSLDHEYVLADNPDIAFIVMYRARFTEAFPKSLPNFGPQELERDIVDTVPGEHAELFLCAVLGLLLNRKQDVKPGHYNRALEEAVQTHKSQWAKDWEAKNPLSQGATFATMQPTQRLTLLRTLVLWSLSSSDTIKGIITTSYKQSRHEDYMNQPLSVQPWGSDGDKRRYYLIEGLDDTHFRVYRESNYTGIKRTWWSVAGTIDELTALAEKLEKEDGGQKAKLLSGKMLAAVPRFEATEEKRKRREYRQARKQQFKRPEPNFSMYEGRTRGKRMKYTYSEGEDESFSDATTNRRSTRNTSNHTPIEGPTVTQSGRQVKSRQGGLYGESILSGQAPSVKSGQYDESSDEPEESIEGRPRRAAAAKVTNGWGGKGKAHIEGYNSVDEMDSDEDDASEQDYGDDEEEDEVIPLESDIDDREDISDEALSDVDSEMKSLVIKLPVKTPTPEKKTLVKSRSSESPDSNHTRAVPAIPPEPSSGTSSNMAKEGGNNDAAAGPISSHILTPDTPPKPIAIAQLDEIPPISPTLAFRGSPEKAHLFPTSLKVSGDP